MTYKIIPLIFLISSVGYGESTNKNHLGLMFAQVPLYQGSDQSKTILMPTVNIQFDRFKWNDYGLEYSFLESRNLGYGIVGYYDPGRQDKNVDNPYQTGSNKLSGMGSIDSTIEFGTYVYYNFFGFLPVFINARKSPDN